MSADLNSIRDAQAQLGCVSRQTIYNLIAAGKLRRVNLGRRAFITGASIDALKAEINAGDPRTKVTASKRSAVSLDAGWEGR